MTRPATPLHVHPVNEQAGIHTANFAPCLLRNKATGGDEVIHLVTGARQRPNTATQPVVGRKGVQVVICFAVAQGRPQPAQASMGSEFDFSVPVLAKLRGQTRSRLAVLIKANDRIGTMRKGLFKTHVQRCSNARIASAIHACNALAPVNAQAALRAVVDQPDLFDIGHERLNQSTQRLRLGMETHHHSSHRLNRRTHGIGGDKASPLYQCQPCQAHGACRTASARKSK